MTTGSRPHKILGAGLYKYVYHGQVIYVGMSKGNKGGVFGRIRKHSKEEKFLPYLDESDIFVSIINDINNPNLIKMYETGLIDQYNPKLNYAEKPSMSSGIDFESLFKLNFRPYKEVYEEYCTERDAHNIKNKDSLKDKGTLRLDKKIEKMERIVEENEQALQFLVSVLECIKKGSYTIVKDEKTGKTLQEINITELGLPYNGIIYTTGMCHRYFRVNHLRGWSFFYKNQPETTGADLFCDVSLELLLKGDSFNQYVENVDMSRQYLNTLYAQKDDLENKNKD